MTKYVLRYKWLALKTNAPIGASIPARRMRMVITLPKMPHSRAVFFIFSVFLQVGAVTHLQTVQNPSKGFSGPQHSDCDAMLAWSCPGGKALLRQFFRHVETPPDIRHRGVSRKGPCCINKRDPQHRLPASGDQPALLTCAVDSQAMRSKGSLDVSPAAPQAQGKHVLAEKAVNFLQATAALTHRTAKP